jgi:hypothetical protein
MKTWKLVSGILSIIFSVFVIIQSGVVGFSNIILENGELSGRAGIIVSMMLLAGGITSIVVRKGDNGGSIALFILYGIGALFGFTLAGSYGDLYIWSWWCLICSVVALISTIKIKKGVPENDNEDTEISITQGEIIAYKTIIALLIVFALSVIIMILYRIYICPI